MAEDGAAFGRTLGLLARAERLMGIFGPDDALAERKARVALGGRGSDDPWKMPALRLQVDREYDDQWWPKVRDYDFYAAARMDLVEGIRSQLLGENLDALILLDRAYPTFARHGDHARAVACAQYGEVAAYLLDDEGQACSWGMTLARHAAHIPHTWSGVWGLIHARVAATVYWGESWDEVENATQECVAALHGTASPIEIAVLRLVGELTLAEGPLLGYHEEMARCVGEVLTALNRRRNAGPLDGLLAAPAVGWLPLARRLRGPIPRGGRGLSHATSAATDVVAATASWLRAWAGRGASIAPPEDCLQWIDDGAIWSVAALPGEPGTARFYDPMPLEDYLDAASEALALWRDINAQEPGATELPAWVFEAAVSVARTDRQFHAGVACTK